MSGGSGRDIFRAASATAEWPIREAWPPSTSRFSITGHTCWIGHESLNRRIGLDRAHAVERLLTLHGLQNVRAATAGSTAVVVCGTASSESS